MGEKSKPTLSHVKSALTRRTDPTLRPTPKPTLSFSSSWSLKLATFRENFVEKPPSNVYRAKGILYFSGYPFRFVYHLSGRRHTVEHSTVRPEQEAVSQLVLIGKGMNREELQQAFDACVDVGGSCSQDLSANHRVVG